MLMYSEYLDFLLSRNIFHFQFWNPGNLQSYGVIINSW